MQVPLVSIRSFRSRILALVLGLVTVALAATVAAVLLTAREVADRDASRQLLSAADTARETLRFRGDQLTAAVNVLTSDFGFKEAVSSGDRDTILSAMTNHRARIAADVLVILDPDGGLQASSLSTLSDTTLADLKQLVVDDVDGQALRLYQLLDGRPYQLVVAPVMAPNAIAWAVMGFALDDRLATDMARLLGVEVSFVVGPAAAQTYVSSSLPAAARSMLPAASSRHAGGSPVRVTAGTEEYLSWARPLRSADGSLALVLQRSLSAAMRPFINLRDAILLIGGFILLLAFLAAAWLSRSATRPILELTRAAERLEAGDYAVEAPAATTREVSQLSKAFNSMRAAIAEREHTIRHQAAHDRLTGLPARDGLRELLAAALASAGDEGRPLALMLVELRQLSDVVGSFGHAAADEVVYEVSLRLVNAIRGSGHVGRIGTDRFALVLDDCGPDELPARLESLVALLREPFSAGDLSLHLEARIGVAVCPDDAATGEALLQRADLALFRARETGAQSCRFVHGDDEAQQRRLALLGDLRRAIDAGELELHYQPKHFLSDAAVRGCEALVRWPHPRFGYVPPTEFIAHAERAGLITAVTNWVLQEAFRQARAWSDEGGALKVSVNVSTVDLADEGFVARVGACLQASGVDPSLMLFEVTEGAAMKDVGRTVRVMEELRTLGIRFSIDDFGTGHSSLAHLQRLPVSELKIDRSFVRDLATRDEDAVIVRSTIDLGHALGLQVVAEGVEDEAGMQALSRLGCDIVQGYFIARPMPPVMFRDWVRQRTL